MSGWPKVGPPPRYRFHPVGPSWDLPFFQRIAQDLANHPAGAAILVEVGEGSDPAWLPGGPAAQAVIERAAAAVPGTLETVPPPVDASARAGDRIRFAVVRPAFEAGDLGVPYGETGTVRADPRGDATRWAVPAEADPGEPKERWPCVLQWHWFSTGRPLLAVRLRLRVVAPPDASAGALAGAAARVRTHLPESIGPVRLELQRATWTRRRAWASGSLSRLSGGRPFLLGPADAARVVRPSRPMAEIDDQVLERHVAVLGASGAGKSTFLAHLARERVRRGLATVVLDVHGDLGPAIAAGLDPRSRERLIAVDAARPAEEVAGVALFPSEDPEGREREAAHLVAALRHLSDDGVERYWGHRLEQTFDVFVRLVEEERGGFLDLYDLLTDPNRREAARIRTHRRVAVRFLDELPGLLRRNPDYLQPAVARVQKVALHPKLARLLDADAGAIDLGARLSGGASIVFRIPSAELGPSECRFAATLLASRAYLAVAAARSSAPGLRVLAVLDEAQAISPGLLAEILAEGRKFGFGAVVATQYAARLAPEALAAAEGAAGSHLVFHIPRSGAAAAGRWVGLDREEAERLLPALPPGIAFADLALSLGPRGFLRTPRPVDPDPRSWRDRCARTAEELGVGAAFFEDAAGGVTADEALLLGLLGLESQSRPGRLETLVEAAQRVAPGLQTVELAARLPTLTERGWVEPTEGNVRLTPAGARRIGVGVSSGATRESDEHRLLLVEAMRIFARHGEWLELVRQGRFDTRLPDGFVRLLPRSIERASPGELLAAARSRSLRWAWRAFGGRNVHVEAEVSGAERPERIRRGLAKAQDAGAAVVFLVSDARRARRVREVLRRHPLRPSEAQVWTLSRAAVRNRQRPLGA
jgi:hypothetical protein